MNRKILVVLAVLAIALAVVAVSIEAQRGGGGGGMRGGSGGGGAAPVPTAAPSNGGNIDNGGNTGNVGNGGNTGNIGNVGNFPPTSVSVPPYAFNIEVGESRQFTYFSYDIAVSYLSASPKQVVIVTLDGKEKLIEVDTTFTGGIYWEDDYLEFTLIPVVLGVNEVGKPTLIRLGGTWDTTMLRFNVLIVDAALLNDFFSPGNY